eukprot:242191-Pelagomonas_calceolata.AAC.2
MGSAPDVPDAHGQPAGSSPTSQALFHVPPAFLWLHELHLFPPFWKPLCPGCPYRRCRDSLFRAAWA